MPPKRRSKTLWVQVGDSVLGLVPVLRNGEVYQALCACVGVAGAQLQAVLLKQRIQHSVLEEHQILSPVRRSALDEGLKIIVAGADVDGARGQTWTKQKRPWPQPSREFWSMRAGQESTSLTKPSAWLRHHLNTVIGGFLAPQEQRGKRDARMSHEKKVWRERA